VLRGGHDHQHGCEDRRILAKGRFVLIEGTKIAAVGSKSERGGRRRSSTRKMILVPGFVDCTVIPGRPACADQSHEPTLGILNARIFPSPSITARKTCMSADDQRLGIASMPASPA